MSDPQEPPRNGDVPERVYDPFAPKFPTLTIVTPDPPRRSTSERYGALFSMGIAGLVVVVSLLGWFGWSAWKMRSVWTNVYVLHDATQAEPERIQAAYNLAHNPNVNQRQLWDVALRKPLPPLARYIIAEALTAEAAIADPRSYGRVIAKSEGWPDWLRLLLLRPIAYAAALGFAIDKPSLIELTKNSDPEIALWAEAALAIGPDRDGEHGAALKRVAEAEGLEQALARTLLRAHEATREPDRIAALDEATRWVRLHHPEAVKIWQGWKDQGGKLVSSLSE